MAQGTEEEDGEEDEDDLSNLRLNDLLAPLQCVICCENATAMYTCANGHRVCTECLMHHASVESTPRVPCAICRDACSWNRDLTAKAVMLAIEQGLGGVPFARCDNAGCRRRIGVEEIDAHRMHCPFRQVMCPNERCQEHVSAAHLTRHLRQHSETLVMREGQSLTAVVFAFNLDCAIVLEGADHEALAVFHMHTNGIHGTPGVYELEQGVVRACCLHSHDANAAWDVRVTNVDATGAFDDVETFRAPIEHRKATRDCRPLAHPSVRYKCDLRHVYAAPFVHLGDDDAASLEWLRRNRSVQRTLAHVTSTSGFDPHAGAMRAAMNVPILVLRIMFARM